MTESHIDHAWQQLERFRQEVEAQLEVLRPRLEDAPGEGVADLVVQLEADLVRIETAFQRLRTGRYGYCIGCGDEIELNRLRADPCATLCLSCARRIQRRNEHEDAPLPNPSRPAGSP